MPTTRAPNVTLNNGVEMPIVGFGVYQIPPDETEGAVDTALEAGYRLYRHRRRLSERGSCRPCHPKQWHSPR